MDEKGNVDDQGESVHLKTSEIHGNEDKVKDNVDSANPFFSQTPVEPSVEAESARTEGNSGDKSENVYPMSSEIYDSKDKNMFDKTNPFFSPTPDNRRSEESENTRNDGLNFWDVNGYKKTVKRIDDGAKLCDDLIKLIGERAEIENLYAGKLQVWKKKWDDLTERGSEYGSLKQSWLQICSEADHVAQIHHEIQDRLIKSVQESVASWKTANYQKAIFSWKQTKKAEEGFAKAQKPWTRRFNTVSKCKKAYIAACKAHDQAEKLYNDAKVAENPEEQVKKLTEKRDKTNLDMLSAQENYKESLRDISSYNPKYKEDMCFVFDKCQKAERERREFFKRTFLSFCEVLNFGKFADRFTRFYHGIYDLINSADIDTDLKWFAATWGTDVPMRLPQFEEYKPVKETIPSVNEPPQTVTSQPDTTEEKAAPQQTSQSRVCTLI